MLYFLNVTLCLVLVNTMTFSLQVNFLSNIHFTLLCITFPLLSDCFSDR